MADPSRYPDSDGDIAEEILTTPRLESNTGTPRWAKVAGIITIAVVVLIVVLLLSGQGHGPERHMKSEGAPPSGAETHHSALAVGFTG